MKIGAQLFTVHDFCKDLDSFAESLKKVADIGYKTVQVSGTCAYEPEWLKEELKKNGKKKVTISTVFTASPGVLEAFEKTEYASRLKATGVITSYICPLMYMNNPLCKKMPVITSSNKLRTYTSARYYTDEEILAAITGGKNA